MRVVSLALVAALGMASSAIGSARADDKPIKIGLVADKTGPLEAYVKQMETGFSLGFEYATKGTNTVAGRKIEIVEKDSQAQARRRPQPAQRGLYRRWRRSGGRRHRVGVALAMLPVAQDNKKILIIEPAVAEFDHRREVEPLYLPHRAQFDPGCDLQRLAIGKPGTVVATLGQDYAFGRDGVAAFKKALEPTGGQGGVRGICAADHHRFHRAAAAHGRRARQGTGPQDPVGDLGRRQSVPGDKGAPTWPSTGSNSPPAVTSCRRWLPTRISPVSRAAAYYYYDIPKNPVNQWLVAEHQKRFNAPPDFFTCGGFSAAMAIVTALEKTKGNTDTETLIKAMEGMDFQTPKGKMEFRKEDHQALQSMYAFKIKVDPNVAWAIPELTKELTIADMKVPVGNIPK